MSYTGPWEDMAEDVYTRFGWTADDNSFIVGDREIKIAETDKVLIGNAIAHYVPLFKPRGSLEGWLKTYSEPTGEGSEVVKFIVSLALGGLLNRFTYQSSYLINLYSETYNPGILPFISSVWGYCQGLGIEENYTQSARLRILDDLGSVPVTLYCADGIKSSLIDDMLASTKNIILAQSSGPIQSDNPNVFNVELPDAEIRFAIENYGVLLEPFVKEVLSNPDMYMIRDKGNSLVNDIMLNSKLALIWLRNYDLHDISLPKYFDQMIMRTPPDFLNQYLYKNKANTIVLNARPKKLCGVYQPPLREPTGEINIRYEPNKKLLYVLVKPFRDYCRRMMIDPELVIAPYLENKSLIEVKCKVMQGFGASYKTKRNCEALWFDVTKLKYFDEQRIIDG